MTINFHNGLNSETLETKWKNPLTDAFSLSQNEKKKMNDKKKETRIEEKEKTPY